MTLFLFNSLGTTSNDIKLILKGINITNLSIIIIHTSYKVQDCFCFFNHTFWDFYGFAKNALLWLYSRGNLCSSSPTPNYTADMFPSLGVFYIATLSPPIFIYICLTSIFVLCDGSPILELYFQKCLWFLFFVHIRSCNS